MDSLEPSAEERPMEEGRKGGEACALHGLAGGSWGRGAACQPSRAPESGCKSGGAGQSVLGQEAGLMIWNVIS